MIKKLYNRHEWILGICEKCNRTNYVEPHGMTAKCQCSVEWTEHKSIPYNARVGALGIEVNTTLLPRIIK